MTIKLTLGALALCAACGSDTAGPAKANKVTEGYLEGLNGSGILETAYLTDQAFRLAGPEQCDYVLRGYEHVGELGKELNALPPKPPGLDRCVTQIDAAKDDFEKGLCDLRAARDTCAAEATAAKATTKLDDAEFCFPLSDTVVPGMEPKAPAPAPPPPP